MALALSRVEGLASGSCSGFPWVTQKAPHTEVRGFALCVKMAVEETAASGLIAWIPETSVPTLGTGGKVGYPRQTPNPRAV